MYIILGLLSALFASLVAIFGKLGLKNLDSTVATTIRSLVMAGFLLALSLTIGKWQSINWHSISSKDWLLIVLAGICGALSWLAYFSALKMGPATTVSALDRLSLVFVAILALVFLGETLTWAKISGVILMVLGVLLLTWK
jgi:transporter family protein